ncbi:DUF5119 domain-containing protein [Parabacteroides sp. AM08-6]|uniref:DUF5119 domain-containing protein n=1 Tax=Parabacteroides sp. AM08-6 TaxID=2292053 RepID=UPI000EFE4084|nr:DUF5119 domain-containing protein [Parabacteroides sp. AM08-6]RHJ78701.1 DUF5119 domain-containing protein [Parabacteroides sp. AM08-6]
MDSKSFLSAGIVFMTLIIVVSMIKCTDEKGEEEQLQGNVYYSFNWNNVLSETSAPQHLRYCFYPIESGSVIQMDDDADGMSFTLPPARYKVLIFNCDADNIAFRNTNKFETAEAYIPETKSKNIEHSGDIPLYGIVNEELIVKAGENSPIEFIPVPLTRKVSIHIKVDGMEHITECKGSISGMATTINLSKQEVLPEATTEIPFQTTTSEEGVDANILMLGKPTEEGETPPVISSHEVKLDFTLTDGSTASTAIDLGNSIEETEGSTIDVSIEATVAKGIAFTVNVKQWKVAPGDKLTIE